MLQAKLRNTEARCGHPLVTNLVHRTSWITVLAVALLLDIFISLALLRVVAAVVHGGTVFQF